VVVNPPGEGAWGPGRSGLNGPVISFRFYLLREAPVPIEWAPPADRVAMNASR